MGEEILSLSTIVDRKTVNINSKQHPNGKLYEFANLADLGPYEHATMLNRNDEFGELQREIGTSKPTAKQERRLHQLLDELVGFAVPALAEKDGKRNPVVGELSVQQKQTLVFTWIGLLTEENTARGEGKAATARRTTGRSSRASKPSTAATRRRGSTSRRGS